MSKAKLTFKPRPKVAETSAASAASTEKNAHEIYGDSSVIDLGNSDGIVIDNQSIVYGSSNLLINASFKFASGKIYGIVARNGLGKSALLNRLNKAKISVSKLLVEQDQELENQDLYVYDAVIGSNVELTNMRKELAELESMGDAIDDNEALLNRYNELQERVAEYDKEDSNVMKILIGMGFTEEHLTKKVSELSGGWRKRVVLASAIYRRPDFLMLDEPTNHLDLEAVLWLETYLKKVYKTQGKRRKTLIVISHNAEFMQSLTETIFNNNPSKNIYQVIVTIEKSKLYYYNMSYNDYVDMQLMRSNQGECKGEYKDVKVVFDKAVLKQDITPRELRAADLNRESFTINFDLFMSDNRIDKEYTPQIHAQFIKLYNNNIPKIPVFPFINPSVPRSIEVDDRRVLNVIRMGFEYVKDKPVLEKICLEVNLGDVYCVCGKNGAGKSTFLKLVADEANAAGPKTVGEMSGLINVTEGTRVGYYSQYSGEQIPPNMSALEYIREINTKYSGSLRSVTDVYELMSFFAIPANVVGIPSKLLSGGQKSRVVLAGLCVMRPHLVILDEPTNHLDVDSIMALKNAIRDSLTNVAFMIITHDPQLMTDIERVKLIEIKDRKLYDYDGTMQDYKEEVLHRLGL